MRSNIRVREAPHKVRDMRRGRGFLGSVGQGVVFLDLPGRGVVFQDLLDIPYESVHYRTLHTRCKIHWPLLSAVPGAWAYSIPFTVQRRKTMSFSVSVPVLSEKTYWI